ncbi:MAG: gluconate 2-dehydrogenase subunit 3 family protein [Pseudomonadota bacterium]
MTSISPRQGLTQAPQPASDADRRWFLKRLTQTLGATGAAALLAGNSLSTALAYQPRKDSADHKGALLSASHMRLLHDICAVTLPRTDTPSAADVDCHGFIDHQLSTCHSTAEQQLTKDFLDALDARSRKTFNTAFVQLPREQQQQLLTQVERKDGFNQAQYGAFKLIKWLMLFGYFTSEVGATQALAYQAVPGGFKGSIPAKADTKGWGSLNYY